MRRDERSKDEDDEADAKKLDNIVSGDIVGEHSGVRLGRARRRRPGLTLTVAQPPSQP